MSMHITLEVDGIVLLIRHNVVVVLPNRRVLRYLNEIGILYELPKSYHIKIFVELENLIGRSSGVF